MDRAGVPHFFELIKSIDESFNIEKDFVAEVTFQAC